MRCAYVTLTPLAGSPIRSLPNCMRVSQALTRLAPRVAGLSLVHERLEDEAQSDVRTVAGVWGYAGVHERPRPDHRRLEQPPSAPIILAAVHHAVASLGELVELGQVEQQPPGCRVEQEVPAVGTHVRCHGLLGTRVDELGALVDCPQAWPPSVLSEKI